MGITMSDIPTMIDYHDNIEPMVFEEMVEDEDYYNELWWEAYRTVHEC
jgi:hypothetical protein